MTALTTQVVVSKQAVSLELRCGTAKCSGVITLVDLKTELGHSKYALAAGKTGYVGVGLFKQALTLLAGAKNHTIGVTETITVTGGKTVTKKITVTTSAPTTTARPVVTTSTVTVHNKSAKLELRCSVATCVGTVTLVDVRTELGHSKYDLGPGKTGDVTLGLSKQALSLLAGAKNHTIDVTETVTVTGGKTATTPITLIG